MMKMSREEFVRKDIFLFIKNYGSNRKVKLDNIRRFSDSKGYSRYAMGNAMQELKSKGAIYFIPKTGWVAR